MSEHPRRWRWNSTFTAPEFRPLCKTELKDIRRAIHDAYECRVPVRGDKRRHRLITSERRAVALVIVQTVADTPKIARAALAGAARTSIGTVDRVLTFLIKIGVLKSHPIIDRDPQGGEVRQEASEYELVALPPPAESPETQLDSDSVCVILPSPFLSIFAVYFSWKQATPGARLLRGLTKRLTGRQAEHGSDSDEWGFASRDRQLALLLGTKQESGSQGGVCRPGFAV